MKNEVFNIVYILGSGRSGSTLISHIIGAHPDFENLGEVYNYGNFLKNDSKRICSDGEVFQESPFWNVVRDALKKKTGSDIINLKETSLQKFEKNNVLFFEALKKATPKPFFVDATKRNYRYQLFKKSTRFNVKAIHFTKDCRSYGFSNDLSHQELKNDKYNFKSKVWDWISKNMTVKFLNIGNKNYMHIRYEDFCQNPQAVMQKIMTFCGSNYTIDQLEFWKTQQHAFSGNTRMVSKGRQDIRWDDRFIKQLSSSKWIYATALALPGLLAFGYPLTRKGLTRRFKK